MNESVIITGGKGDLAKAIAQRFLSVKTPGRHELDVNSQDSIDQYFRDKSPTLLICNAGIIDDKPLLKAGSDSWDSLLQTNLTGAMRCSRAVIRSMARERQGHIIFIGSYLGIHPAYGTSVYSASKAALQGFMHSLAQELGSRNVRVNLVLPGFLETKMTANVSADRKAMVAEAHCLNHLNTVGSVARFIQCLHEDLVHTSGQIFNLDSRII